MQYKFTFHYGSILMLASLQYLTDIMQFTFHYGSILIKMEDKDMRTIKNLHSTMVLF